MTAFGLVKALGEADYAQGSASKLADGFSLELFSQVCQSALKTPKTS